MDIITYKINKLCARIAQHRFLGTVVYCGQGQGRREMKLTKQRQHSGNETREDAD